MGISEKTKIMRKITEYKENQIEKEKRNKLKEMNEKRDNKIENSRAYQRAKEMLKEGERKLEKALMSAGYEEENVWKDEIYEHTDNNPSHYIRYTAINEEEEAVEEEANRKIKQLKEMETTAEYKIITAQTKKEKDEILNSFIEAVDKL